MRGSTFHYDPFRTMDPITITVRENGPFVIAGDDMARVRLVDAQGQTVSTEGRKAIALCRCGASTTKPFCDGTHSKIGFRGAEAAQAAYDAGRVGETTDTPPAA
ncbi:MAG TPA: CDGSH iron-sulfur domain-containing protein [Gemmatirosa sp.]